MSSLAEEVNPIEIPTELLRKTKHEQKNTLIANCKKRERLTL